MNTRERLINFRKQLSDHVNGRSSCLNADDVALLEKLIAERPYEPGDEIQIKVREEDAWKPAKFIAVDPDDSEYIIYRPLDISSGVTEWRCRFHRRVPKTYRLKPVPVDIMEQAKQAVRLAAKCEVPPHPVIEWLANPENWEADND